MQVFDDSSEYHVHHGDCIPHMLEAMPENSVDFAVFSPPFPSLYAYTASEADVGNVDAMVQRHQCISVSCSLVLCEC